MPWTVGLYSRVRGMFTLGTWTVVCGVSFERSGTVQSKLPLKYSIRTLPSLASTSAFPFTTGAVEAASADSGRGGGGGATAKVTSAQNSQAQMLFDMAVGGRPCSSNRPDTCS